MQQYLHDLKKSSDNQEISEDIYKTYSDIIEHEGCMDSVSLNKFHVTSNYIEIHDDCEFPHAMLADAPYYELKFNLQSLKNILNPEIINRLTKKK